MVFSVFSIVTVLLFCGSPGIEMFSLFIQIEGLKKHAEECCSSTGLTICYIGKVECEIMPADDQC